MTFAATIMTLHAEMFPGPLGVYLSGRALEDGKWSLDNDGHYSQCDVFALHVDTRRKGGVNFTT